MGTRADFYTRNEKSMEYLGSIAFDGYEIDDNVLQAKTEQSFREELAKFFSDRNDYSVPEQHGWPWPWNDSRTTDYSYVFENGKVLASNWGRALYDPLIQQADENGGDEQDEQKLDNFWPDMSALKNVRFDKGSGLLIIAHK